MQNVEPAVHSAILEVVQEGNPSITKVANHQSLNADLGLKSLDVARIVANLDMTLEADPFSELVSITSVRTVGDLVNAYRSFFDKDHVPQSQELEAGRDRAKSRQEAIAGLRGRRDPSARKGNGDSDAS